MLTVYAKYEPTTDAVIINMAPAQAKRKRDLQIYKDEACTIPFARFMWWQKRPTRRSKTVILNCFRWNIVCPN